MNEKGKKAYVFSSSYFLGDQTVKLEANLNKHKIVFK